MVSRFILTIAAALHLAVPSLGYRAHVSHEHLEKEQEVDIANRTDRDKCDGHHYVTGKTLGEGRNGIVVLAKDGRGKEKAIKKAAQKEDFELEVAAMSYAKEQKCSNKDGGVLPIEDAEPCKETKGKWVRITNGFVLPVIHTTLFTWLGITWQNVASNALLYECRGKIATVLAKALECLHAGGSGFMHGDLHADNVYLIDESMSIRKCPSKVYLGDLGEAVRIGDSKLKFPWMVDVEDTQNGGTKTMNNSKSASHLPSAVFKGKEDFLKVTDPNNPDRYIASGVIDWCGFQRLLDKMWMKNGKKKTKHAQAEWDKTADNLLGGRASGCWTA